jgi:hypothetical protein
MSGKPFFIGWSAGVPRRDRRFLLGAGLAVAAAGCAGLGAAVASGRVAIGSGVWDQGSVHRLRGVISAHPYPLLRTQDLGAPVRTVFLATDGKAAFRLPAALQGRWVEATGTLITRDGNAMMAVEAIVPGAGPAALPAPVHEPQAVDRGEVVLIGEILDAKCWFGAMRPGYGKAHKACAALCARGGLPLAFCQAGTCGTGSRAPLFLDSDGRAHARAVLPLVADPVLVRGRLFEVGDVMQFRAGLAAIRRL